MKFISSTLSNLRANLLSALKPMAIAAVCALFLFANATPALAFGNSSSKASDGLEQLDGIQQKSEQAAASGAKAGANSAKSVRKDANRGLNGVQGQANKGDMISPNDANGNTIEGAIEDSLQEIK